MKIFVKSFRSFKIISEQFTVYIFSELFDLSKKKLFTVQKQPPEVFYIKRCSQKFDKIHRKTPVPESLY